MIELITGIEFNGAEQGDCDPEVMLAESEVYEAIARGEIPKSPMNSAVHADHPKEGMVQAYLRQHGMQTGLVYQSAFVGWGLATAVDEGNVKRYGFPFVVKPGIVQELAVACLGDLQTVVNTLERRDEGFLVDDRIVNLNIVSDRLKALRQLCLQAQEHNAKIHSNLIFIEARVYRAWNRDDLERPCTLDDYRKNPRVSRRGFRRTGTAASWSAPNLPSKATEKKK